MSMFVWLDYSEHERRKMLDVIDLFRESETVDELGLGTIRDAFADMLFPGTSTIMTRARYFLLVPWICRRLEARGTSSAEVAAKCRDAEIKLINIIEKSEDKVGNIGRVARAKLKRPASNIYWQGLGVWGIRTFPGSQEQYNRSLDAYYESVKRHQRRLRERDTEHDDIVTGNWDGGLIEPPSDFPAVCSLRLRRKDAEYLRDRITLSAGCQGSLLRELLRHAKREADTDFAWEHPQAATLPSPLAARLEHARNFSEIMHGAALLYNLILAEQQGREQSIGHYRDRMEDWIRLIEGRRDALTQWKPKDFWECILDHNPRVGTNSRAFVQAWWDFVLGNDLDGISRAAGPRILVTQRERQLKKKLARIDNQRALELWTGASGSSQLDFRWGISQTLLGDIFDGLEANNA